MGLTDDRAAHRMAGEPTVAALARAADEMFAALPAAQRERLGDVPALVTRLRTGAARLRGRVDDPAAAERLQITVAALEAMPLDLLKLRAGAGTLDDLTRDVEAACEIGRRVDSELAARAELAAPRRLR